jgi:alkylation response protein AidB-like acyl-CoA dehydrogenase
MTLTEHPPTTTRSVIDELDDWLADNWNPDLSLGEWWERLGMAGWSNPLLPAKAYGRALPRGEALAVGRTIAAHGAVGAPAGLGLMLAAPTIATHGTPEQIERYVPDIVTGRKAWCQLFSEPGAGSDLAGLTSRAERDGDVWRVTGQKVWTSGGHVADLGMLLARTNGDVPKHQGITWFVLDMHQAGVDVRPLKEMTGHAMFSEVFMSDAEAHDDQRIGDTNNGWAVANTTLLWERAGMGAGGGGRPGRGALFAQPGTVANLLGRRVGDFAPSAARRTTNVGAPDPADRERENRSPAQGYIELARRHGKLDDPIIRQELVRLHTLTTLAALNTERHKAVRASGGDIAGIANFSKLAMADVVRLQRDLGLTILGALGTLHGYTDDDRRAVRDALDGADEPAITLQALGAQALPIYGGTDQIQRNVIGERVLGLPKEPGDVSRLPFNEIPKNG